MEFEAEMNDETVTRNDDIGGTGRWTTISRAGISIE